MMRRSFWLLLSAAMLLSLGSCTLEDQCTPGETMCTGKTFHRCLLTGKAWEKVICGSDTHPGPFCHAEKVCVACDDDKHCQAGVTHCVDHVCEPLSVKGCDDGATMCETGKVYICSKKLWENGIFCAQGCNAEGTACALAGESCVQDTTKCTNDGRFVVCRDDQWIASDCEKGQVCPVGKTACEDFVCEDGLAKCSDTKDGVMTCKDNAWIVSTCDAGQECKKGETQCSDIVVSICTSGQTQCVDNKLQTCTANAWDAGAACPRGHECKVDDTKCTDMISVACMADNTRCSAGKLETCTKFNVWGAGVNCKKGEECPDGGFACKTSSCENNDTRCENNKLQSCTNHVWDEGMECSDGAICLVGDNGCSSVLCAFTAIESSPVSATATGKVIVSKGLVVTGGGIYCTDDLTQMLSDWDKPFAAPTKNTAYTGSGDEWKSGTLINIRPTTNYCSYVIKLGENDYYRCPVSGILAESSYSIHEILTAKDTYTIQITCGNGIKEGAEECDGAAIGKAVCPIDTTGGVTCTNRCKLNFSGCYDSSMGYNYVENFSAFKETVTYRSEQTIGNATVIGVIDGTNSTIDGKTLIIGDKTEGSLKIANLPNGIGSLRFQYQSLGTDVFDQARHVIQIHINDEKAPVARLPLNGNYESAQAITITLNRDATSFTLIKPFTGGSDNAPRILIDNVVWSDKK